MRVLAAACAPLLLAGCASYTPVPLEGDLTSLSAPVAAVLSQDAAALSRPYLSPATIDLAGPLDPNMPWWRKLMMSTFR